MSGSRPDVVWCPQNGNRFVICDSEISLYRVDAARGGGGVEARDGSHRLSEDSTATLLDVNSETPYMKCMAWCPWQKSECLLAVGQANGRVVLTSLGQDGLARHKELVGKEFVPKHARQCNALAWNPHDRSLLGAGLDKHRADFSALVWDVNAKFTASEGASAAAIMERGRLLLSGEAETNMVVTKPVCEFGQNDACLSLAWLPRDARLLLAGMQRNLVTYDLRDTTQKKLFANTKAVQGVTFDPHFPDRFASFFEGQVAVWDLRVPDKPVLTLNEPSRQLSKVAWCPTRTGLLATLARDSGVVRLYDMQHTAPGALGDEAEPPIIERSVQPCDGAVASFAWVPTSQNGMLALSQSRALVDFTVFERIALDWCPAASLVWACGRQLYNCAECPAGAGQVAEQDISAKMKRRALNRYGVETELVWTNHVLAMDDDPQLKSLWYTLHFMKRYVQEQEDKPGSQPPAVYQGIKAIVRPDPGKPESLRLSCSDPERRLEVYTFDSAERRLALRLCGWTGPPALAGDERDDRGDEASTATSAAAPSSSSRPSPGPAPSPAQERPPLRSALEPDEEWERRAAMALFHLRMRAAIDILQQGAACASGDVNLNVVAMALSGYSAERASLWREMCAALRLQLSNPYLRAAFAFLTSDAGSYEHVLNERGMAVRDRVAFACMFLSDAQLSRFVEKLAVEMREAGNLEGMLLTGLTRDGIDLMESYVDRTGDVQTACLYMLQASSSDIVMEARVQHWVESYRTLLDTWRLWHKRAEFDIHRSKLDATARPLQQVFVSCNFCGKSISFSGSTTTHPTRSGFSQYGGSGSPVKSKVTSCPGCRKPLPRCALCLINMGTAASNYTGLSKPEVKGGLSKERKLSQFNSWFTWCQNCRHGGHAGHMMSWFREHAECPVSACTCKCMQLDATGSLAPAEPL